MVELGDKKPVGFESDWLSFRDVAVKPVGFERSNQFQPIILLKHAAGFGAGLSIF